MNATYGCHFLIVGTGDDSHWYVMTTQVVDKVKYTGNKIECHLLFELIEGSGNLFCRSAMLGKNVS